jgi:hypothetical protein
MMEGNAARALSATAANPKAIWCDISARSRQRFSAPRFRFSQGPVLEYKILRAPPCGGDVMARLLFGTILVAALSVPFIAMSYNEASAQERATCSQARAHCGTQRVCQRRYEACMETGCWTVTLVRRCGYEKR